MAAVLFASSVGVGVAGPAYAKVPTVSTVVLNGTPASPSFTLTGTGFGKNAPTARPADPPCGSADGHDYGKALWVRDLHAVFGPQTVWTAGFSEPTGLDCIGLVVDSWTKSSISFSLGSAYDNADYQLTEGDPLQLVVKGATLSFRAHYEGGPPQAPTETWCTPNPESSQVQCASAYIHWDGSLSSISQAVTVNHLGSTTYVATLWNGGYTGIQNDGNSVTHVVGPTAVFSLGGTGVKIAKVHGEKNPNCEKGFDAGSGASCRIPLPHSIDDHTTYKYVVTRAASGWITGSVVLPGGQKLVIGRLKPGPAAPTDFESLTNFIEDFGPNVATIGQVPHSSIRFGLLTVPTGASRLSFVCAYAANNGSGSPVLDFGGTSCV